MSNLYDQHKHLNEAMIACENDSQCIGIYDDSCDKDGPFLLLKSGFVTSVSGTNCIYKKTIYSKLKAKETLNKKLNQIKSVFIALRHKIYMYIFQRHGL